MQQTIESKNQIDLNLRQFAVESTQKNMPYIQWVFLRGERDTVKI